MKNLVSRRSLRIITAVASMALFSAVFFALPVTGVLAVAAFCLLTLCGVMWIGGQTDRSIARAIAAFDAEPPAPVPPVIGPLSPQPAR
jgi:hypothetical protein